MNLRYFLYSQSELARSGLAVKRLSCDSDLDPNERTSVFGNNLTTHHRHLPVKKIKKIHEQMMTS